MSQSGIVGIRCFQQSDIDDLIALFRLSVHEVASAHYSPAQCLAWAPDKIDRATWMKKRSDTPTWVAVCNAQIAGFTDLEADGHIDMLFVHPAYQRQGIAAKLIAHVHEEARRQSISRLFTEASITARPVFEHFGFMVIAEQSVHHNGQDFTNFRMEKYL